MEGINKKGKILFVENEQNWRDAIRHILIEYDVQIATSFEESLHTLESSDSFDLLIINMNLISSEITERDRLGAKLLYKISEMGHPAPRIIITGDTDIPVRDWFDKYKVCDIFIKERFESHRFLKTIEETISKKVAVRQPPSPKLESKPFVKTHRESPSNDYLPKDQNSLKASPKAEKEPQQNQNLPKAKINRKPISLIPQAKIDEQFGFIGSGPLMSKLKTSIDKLAKSECPSILITGETGTGKGLIALGIHNASRRSNKHFEVCTCPAIPDTLLESELFGYIKGAFTGAVSNKPGAFIKANRGTIFLDEFGDLKLELQAKLLRVLEARKIKPVGATEETAINVRVIAATNKDLEQAIEDGLFREDLYHRVNKIEVKTIPLRALIRDHKSNLMQIISHIVREKNNNNTIINVSKDSIDLLFEYPMEGNIRQLENAIYKAIMLGDDKQTLTIKEEYLIKGTGTANDAKIIADCEHHLRNFINKLRKAGIEPVSKEAVAKKIVLIVEKKISAREQIIEFITSFGAIDRGIASIFTENKETWTRKILINELHLKLDKKHSLYFY